ncbi:hypothetical protein EOL96_02170 [Candidatus Saccharibacteria bacterium]|nr:hypothetical protein [Candidatus Saccharibacteria bacterium]
MAIVAHADKLNDIFVGLVTSAIDYKVAAEDAVVVGAFGAVTRPDAHDNEADERHGTNRGEQFNER